MVRPDKISPLIKGSVATSSLVAGIMNAKYVNGMPLARQEREFARYDLNLSTKKLSRPSGRLTLIIRFDHALCCHTAVSVMGQAGGNNGIRNLVELTSLFS